MSMILTLTNNSLLTTDKPAACTVGGCKTKVVKRRTN